MNKRGLAGFLGIVIALFAVAPLAQAQTDSHRVISMVVPFPAGGGPDFAARVLADKLHERLGQTVVIQNIPGASSMLGARAVARAAPDGRTVLFTASTTVIAPHVLAQGTGPYADLLDNLVPIIAPATTPMVLVAHPRLGVKTLKELIELARISNPKLTYGSAGVGSGTHFAGEMFKQSAGVDLLHVPYQGVAPSIIGAVRGDTSVLFAALGATLPQIKEGKLIPLAVTEKRRSPLLPDVPTATEQGVANVEIHAWYGVFAPAGTPTGVRDRLNREINAVLALPDVKERLASNGIEVLGGDAGQLAEFVKLDGERYGAIARKLNIQVN